MIKLQKILKQLKIEKIKKIENKPIFRKSIQIIKYINFIIKNRDILINTYTYKKDFSEIILCLINNNKILNIKIFDNLFEITTSYTYKEDTELYKSTIIHKNIIKYKIDWLLS
jgi:hypothetical protein